MPTNDHTLLAVPAPVRPPETLLVAVPALARFAALGAAGSRRFKKEVLRVGRFVHPTTGQELDFNNAFLARLVTATNRWIELGHKVWFPVGADCHFEDANDARQNLGYWSSFRVEGHSIVADVEVLDVAAAEKIGRTIQDVSPAIQWNALSSTGEKLEAVIVHVAATPCPVIPKQQNFVPLAREVRMEETEKPQAEKKSADEDAAETAVLEGEPKSDAGAVLSKAKTLLGLPEDADATAFLRALSDALADDEDEVAEGTVPPAALSQRVKELEERLADQERESAEREILLARETSVRAGVPLSKDAVEDARRLFLSGEKDIARRILKLAASPPATTTPASARVTSQPNPGLRDEDEKAIERDRVLERAYLSQGLRVEKDARGRITRVERPPQARK
jgi:hypothetical protein